MRKHTKKICQVLIIMSILFCLLSCSLSTSINDEFYPYSTLEVFEGFFSQVTFRSKDMIYPTTYRSNGTNYVVAVINGFENEADAISLTGTLSVNSGIMAINSNAFLMADNITSVILPSSCQSLGTCSLPQRASSITISWAAGKDLNKAIADENKKYLKELTITGNAMSTIRGKFNNLEKVKVVTEIEGGDLFWPSLPVLDKKGALYFTGWVDSTGERIVSGTKVTTEDATAVPSYSETPPDVPITEDDDETISTGAGFTIPYILMATEKQYSFTFTDNKDGTYTIKPGTSEGVTFETEFDSQKVDADLNENGEWVFQVKQQGRHTFTCFYNNEEEDKPVGYAQVTFTATHVV